MKKVFTIILCAVLSVNIALAQSQSSAGKAPRRIKSNHTNEIQKSINNISGAITSLNNYVPNSTTVLNFEITFASPDDEYLDGLSLTFPTGMTPIVTGTSDPIAASTGCSSATGQLNTISGQTISWGEITTPTQCGYLTPGVYSFSVGVTIGAVTGNQSVTYTAFGDGYGSAPHTFTGSIQLSEASSNDVGVTSIDISGFYLPTTVVTPKATVKNNGTLAQTFDVSFTINNGTTNVYTDTFNVANMAIGTTLQITFDSLWTTVLGNYTVTVETHLTGDTIVADNSKTKTVVVGSYSEAYTGNTGDNTYNTINLVTGANTAIGTINSTPFPMAEEFNGTNIYRVYNDNSFGTVGGDGSFTLLDTLTGVSGTPTGLAWNWTTSTMYVMVLDNANLPQLCTLNMSTYVLTLIGAGTEGFIIAMDFASDGFLYGPSLSPDSLYKIDPATGLTTPIGPLGVDINYGQDVSYDYATGELYTVTCGATYQFGTYNLTTGAFSLIADANGQQHPTLVITNDPSSVNADDVLVTAITPIASGCGLSAAQSIEITVKNVGTNPQSNIPVYYTINGGTQVTGSIAGPLAAGASFTYSFTTTANFSVAGAYTIVACTALLNDENVNNDCKTIVVNNFTPSSIPYVMGFETTDDLSAWKIEDVNDDNSPWVYASSTTLAHTGTGYARYNYNSANAANDWMFSKCINLTAGTNYELTFWYRVGSGYPEKLKVSMGTSQTVAGMTQVIKDLGTISDTNYTKSTTVFTPSATGTYYFGWYAYSDADQFFIAVDDVKIDIPTGIDKNDNDHSVNIYPNPAKNQLNITSNNNIENIKVINAIGQVMVNQKVGTQFHTLNTSSYNYGIYFIQIETKDGIVTKRFVIAE